MKSLETSLLAAACLAVGAGSAELYHSTPTSVPLVELRVVYFDPDKGRSVEAIATEADYHDGGVRLWYGSGVPPQDVKARGVVVVRPHTIPVE